MEIDFSNVERFVLRDRALRDKLPLADLFRQWELCQFSPTLKPEAQKIALDLLNRLGDYAGTLEEHFGEPVAVEKLKYTLIENRVVGLGEDIGRPDGEVFLWRNADHLYIGTWN